MTYQELYKEKLLQRIIECSRGLIYNNFKLSFNEMGGVIEWSNQLDLVYATPFYDGCDNLPISIEEVGSPITKMVDAPFELTYSDISLDTKKYFDIMDIVLTNYDKLG